MANPPLPVTPAAIAAGLQSMVVAPATARLGIPDTYKAKQGAQMTVVGRVTVTYGSKSVTLTPEALSDAAHTRKLFKMVHPDLSIGARRYREVKAVLPDVLRALHEAGKESLILADTATLNARRDKILRDRKVKAEKAMSAEAISSLTSLFNQYHDQLDEERIVELWRLTVARKVTES